MSGINELMGANMTRSQLEELSRLAAERLAKMDAEEAKREGIKKNYQLEPFEYNWTINLNEFYRNVCAAIASGVSVDAILLDQIKEKSSEAVPLDYTMIYRCPDCGELGSLYVGMYEGNHPDVCGYAVTCGYCSFTMADNTNSSQWAAWETFHEWLIKKGFLPKGTKQPEQSHRKWN